MRALGPIPAVLLALALAGTSPPAAADVEVYESKSRLAEDLLPLAETVLAGRGKVAADPGTNSLVLVGDAAVLTEVLAFLEQHDAALKSVLLSYESRVEADLAAEGVRVRWSVDVGGLRIGNVIPPDGETGVVVGSVGEVVRASDDLRGTLRLLPGATGRIATGTAVPYTVGGPRYRSTEFVNAETGFRVTPRLLGDGRVRLELEPFGARMNPDGTISGFGAATTVDVAPGETVVVGGITRRAGAARRDLAAGSVQSGARFDRLLLVRVELE